jgi:arsenate reductase
VLILCTGNSARSQLAEGLLRHDAGERFEVESAGRKASFVRPEAITVMRELGIDISGQRSKNIDQFEGERFDYVIGLRQCPGNLPGILRQRRKVASRFSGPRGSYRR